MILISKVRTLASNKINLMALIRTLTISSTTLERMKEKFYGFRQTVKATSHSAIFTISARLLREEVLKSKLARRVGRIVGYLFK